MFNSALNTIYDEHRSLAAVVQGLRFIVAKYRQGRGQPDFRLLRAMVFYLEEFPQKLHHPKEDAYLFARLQLRTRMADSVIAELRAQHVAGIHHVSNLHAALDRYESSTEDGLEEFSLAVEQFSDDVLRHMAVEESCLLPLARRHLSAEDWVEIGVAFGENGDPRFIADAHDSFSELFSRILKLGAPDSSMGFKAQ